MPTDEDLRRVAEDVRALARSLQRDIRDVVEQARRSSRNMRDELRDAADEARRGVRSGWCRDPRGGRDSGPQPPPGWYGGWGPAPGRDRYGPPWRRARRRARTILWPPGPSGAAVPGGAGSPWPDSAGPDGTVPGGAGTGGPGGRGAGASSRGGWGGPGGRRTRGGRAPDGPTWTRPPRRAERRAALPPLRHRRDGLAVLGVLAAFFALAWLAASIHLTGVSVESVAAVGLMFLGAALIVTGRTDWGLSRRRWPVWLGLALVVVLVASSGSFGLDHAGANVAFGKRTVAPAASYAQLPSTVHGGFGELDVDLSRLRGAPRGNRTLDVVALAGRIQIALPEGARVHLDAQVIGGQICVDGRPVDRGVAARVNEDVRTGTTPQGPGTLTLTVRQGFGEVDVGPRLGGRCG